MRSSFAIAGSPFSLGPFIKCPYPEMIEVCALAGFDFAVVDMEHTPVTVRDLYALVLAAERRSLQLVVRVPANSEMYFKWCLDLGVRFILVPHVESKADAEAAVAHSFFSPKGERGLCRFVRAADFSATTKDAYLARASAETRLILQVEGKRGLDNVAEILSVPGIDTLFIGPYDLSQALGTPGNIWDATVVDAMKRIEAASRSAGVRVATFADSPEGVRFWVEAGMSMIAYASDLSILLAGAEQLRAALAARPPGQ
jgi:4-hydroxy-2-oxoheptanedioate aldolase